MHKLCQIQHTIHDFLNVNEMLFAGRIYGQHINFDHINGDGFVTSGKTRDHLIFHFLCYFLLDLLRYGQIRPMPFFLLVSIFSIVLDGSINLAKTIRSSVFLHPCIYLAPAPDSNQLFSNALMSISVPQW